MIAFAHHAALLPLAYLLAFRRDAPMPYWLVAVGFSASWFADTVALASDGAWTATQFYPGVQLGLFAYAFGSVLAPAVLFSLSLLPPYTGPDVLVTVIGSVAVLGLASGKLAAPVALYAGVGTVLYLLMITELRTERFMWFWYPYQGVRIAAFALFVRAAHAVE